MWPFKTTIVYWILRNRVIGIYFFKLYRDLETPDLSSSRKLNIYIKTSYVFLSAVRINNLGAFSDILLKQRKWTNSQVLRKRNIILSNNRAAAKEFFFKMEDYDCKNSYLSVLRC